MSLRVIKYLVSDLGVFGDSGCFLRVIGVFLRVIKCLGSNLAVLEFLDTQDHWVF